VGAVEKVNPYAGDGSILIKKDVISAIEALDK
jgi:hypothetical protein